MKVMIFFGLACSMISVVSEAAHPAKFRDPAGADSPGIAEIKAAIKEEGKFIEVSKLPYVGSTIKWSETPEGRNFIVNFYETVETICDSATVIKGQEAVFCFTKW